MWKHVFFNAPKPKKYGVRVYLDGKLEYIVTFKSKRERRDFISENFPDSEKIRKISLIV